MLAVPHLRDLAAGPSRRMPRLRVVAVRLSNKLGYWGEAVVLKDLSQQAQRRGWGFAVPLSPNFPADVLDLRPTGPIFVEVKTTRNPKRQPQPSAAEAAFAETCRTMGAKAMLATVRVEGRGWPPARYSLSYSPIPRVGPRVGKRPSRSAPKLRAAAVPPFAEPSPVWAAAPRAELPPHGRTIGPDRALGIVPRNEGTADGTTVAATSPSSAAPQG